jgi:glycosyltransferase involved in cell wall biosynthesis
MPTLSIIMPVLDEAATIADALAALEPCRARGAEIIVVDGGSRDGTVEAARRFADRVMTAPRGRGSQMNAGAAAAQGGVLLFLHADTRLPPEAIGKDFRADGAVFGLTGSETGIEASLWGLLGVKLGWVEGLEVNLLTLVAGLDIRHPAVKLPGFGRLGIESAAPTATAKPR